MRPIVAVVLLVSLAAPAVAAPVEAGAGPPVVEVAPPAETVGYRRPVEGPVLTPFVAPAHRYGPGHRGVDIGAAVGTPVRAAGRGRVVFAGPVAGVVWVSVDHPDGIRTSYGPLAEVAVTAGQEVTTATVLGTLAGGHRTDGRPALHWSARNGPDRYLDPMRLLDRRRWQATLVGPGGWVATDAPVLPGYEPWTGERTWWGWVEGSPTADGPGWVLPPNPNHVIGIAGYESYTGADAPFDLTHLGYRPEDITYLSYAGRREGSDPQDPRRDQLPYGPEDTRRGVHEAALRLRAQLRAQWARHPGQAVDLVGHSMGGVVALYYLMVLHDPADPTLPPIGHVITLASPVEGTPAAEVGRDLGDDEVLRLLLGPLGLRDRMVNPATADLEPGSPVLDAIGAGWARAREDPYRSPLATGTRIATIGAAADQLVPEHRSDLPGGEHSVLPGTHSSVRDTEAVRIAVRAVLAGEPLPGSAGGLPHLASYAVEGGYYFAEALWEVAKTRLLVRLLRS